MTKANPILLRPVSVSDASEVWKILSDATDTDGMSSLPGSLAATEQLCGHSAELLAELAAGSYRPTTGAVDRLLLVAEHPNNGIVGLTGCSFKHGVPNLGVRVETSLDGLGLSMHSASQPWTRTELDSSYLKPEARGQGHGAVLSRGRLMLLHLLSSQIPTSVVSHLRGTFDDDGNAPFWRHFGHRFVPAWATSAVAEEALGRDPSELQQLAGKSSPVSADVLDCLGKVNHASLPAFRALISEGLEPTELFDPVDGGPTVRAELDQTVTRRLRIHGRAKILSEVDGPDSLIGTVSIGSFRLTRGRAAGGDDGTVVITEGTAYRLGVDSSRLVAAAPLARAMDIEPAGANGEEPPGGQPNGGAE